jgi:adenylate cyclase
MPDTVNLTHHRITVLLIDDQVMIGEAVRRMLSAEEDIDFHYCQDPTQAVKIANEIAPTVILQDLVMPEVDGLLLVRYFRANPTTQEVPLIVLSGKEEPTIKAEAFALGANDYMVKWPDPLEVIARIRYHSQGYITLLERNEAYNALLESQKQLEIRNRFIREAFGRYLSNDVVDAILETPEGLKIGGEKREVTVLMADLRGFASTCERLSAEAVVNILNTYLETMTEIVLKYRGNINEFIGDAILVIFGAPILRDNDAKRAVACALEMQQAMAKVNELNRQQGYSEVTMGIGINTGEAIVGNIGSKKRTKYDVVGHNVNLASRIESYTVGGQIFISESTKETCSSVLRIDDQIEVMPKGLKEPITIYEVGGIGDDFNIFLPEKERAELIKLQPPLPVRFTILEGKHSGKNAYIGSMVKLATRVAEIQGSRNCRELTDLKLLLFDDEGSEITSELYAKVTEKLSDSPPAFRVNFTSVPPEAEIFFEKVLDSHQHPPFVKGNNRDSRSSTNSGSFLPENH